MNHAKKAANAAAEAANAAKPLAEVSLPSDADLDGAAELARLVADRTRLGILALLAPRELSVGEIAQKLNRPVASVSQHLAKLRIGRLVSSRRAGTTIYSLTLAERARALRPAPHHEAPPPGAEDHGRRASLLPVTDRS
ncbi:ArsR/SmtB family transcription factor [Sinomonas mesophila]|uniref:ArsR/SmtB family transcription factor n=1 Tax=Sinomonas mesophila TaxID=1531955 RepID=UPI00158F286C|nr:metalloregulator ArsR/SmtB family transcription factor [Sinomonas mesophila]